MLSVCPQVHYLHRPIALWCGLNHSLVLSQTSDFSKELLGCGCGAGGRLPGWPKGSASFVKLHIKVRAESGKGMDGEDRAIEPGAPQDRSQDLPAFSQKVFKIGRGGAVPQRTHGGQRTAGESQVAPSSTLVTKLGSKRSHLTGFLFKEILTVKPRPGLNSRLYWLSCITMPNLHLGPLKGPIGSISPVP